MSEARVTRLLPIACLLAALVLFASELMTMFEFTPPGGEPLDDQSSGERHGNALFLIAAFAVGALALAVFTASKPAAVAVGAMGVIALLFFLLSDLPDVNQVGTLDDARGSFIDAEAVPREGFWLMMMGSLALAVTGVALATLTPTQLAALGPGGKAGNEAERRAGAHAASRGPGATGPSAEPQAAHERATERIRSRQRG